MLHTGDAGDCVCSGSGPALCSNGAREIKTVLLPASRPVTVQSNVATMLFHPVRGTTTAGTVKVLGPNRLRRPQRRQPHGPRPLLRAGGQHAGVQAMLKRASQRPRSGGFTLIESMIAVAISAILASLSYPTFAEQLRKGRRVDAIARLAQLQQAEERWRANNTSYGSLAALGIAAQTADGLYRLSVVDAQATGYVVLAEAQGGQSRDAAVPLHAAERRRWQYSTQLRRGCERRQQRSHQRSVLESMKAARRNHAQPPVQRGLSLVETLVGIAITLIVVAGALKMFVGHLEGDRRLLLEARLHQDLRAASDLIARDLRRAGYWQQAVQGTHWPAQPIRTARCRRPARPAALTSYSYSRDAAENNSLDSNETFGLRLSAGALQLLEGSGGWQQLTDAGTVLVTSLAITPQTRSIDLGHLCSPACTSADPACPRLNLRHYDIVIRGRATSDASVTREVRESVRVRNDELPTVGCP